jgi:5-methylcytosine-specific restriction endonuclease McrA
MPPRSIYNDHTWRKISRLQRKREPLCERCSAAGRLAHAEVVHHKIPITEATRHLMYDVSNLECMCRECHEVEHHRAAGYSNEFDASGHYVDPRHPSNQPRPNIARPTPARR